MKLNELKTLVAEARMIARTLTAKVMNCVDGSGKYDKEWTHMSTVLTSLCDHIDGTDPAIRMAIEVAILFGANPEEAEKMKNDPEFVNKIKKAGEGIKSAMASGPSDPQTATTPNCPSVVDCRGEVVYEGVLAAEGGAK